jgi:uncharacterized protein YaiI (UPF0178 family)
MKIWVDADARPVVIKETLFHAAARTGIEKSTKYKHPFS